MKNFTLLFILMGTCSACTSITYTETPISPTLSTKTLEIRRFGTETSIEGLNYVTSVEGKSLNFTGYASDETKAIGAAVNAAVSAAIAGVKP